MENPGFFLLFSGDPAPCYAFPGQFMKMVSAKSSNHLPTAIWLMLPIESLPPRPEISDPCPAFRLSIAYRNLLQFKASVGMQYEHVPVRFVLRKYRPTHPAEILSPDHMRLRFRIAVLKLYAFNGPVCVQFPTLTFPVPCIFADLAQPCIQAAPAFKPVDVQKCLIKGLLQKFLRHTLIPCKGQKKAMNRLRVLFVHLLKTAHAFAPLLPQRCRTSCHSI